MRTLSALLLGLALALPCTAAGIDQLSNQEAGAGLKEALNTASSAAISQLGAPDGFLSNDKVHIPLPPALQKAQKVLRALGHDKDSEALETAMNHAAEAAVAEARPILVNAVKKMSLTDAKDILTGGDTAATDYFRRTTSEAITARFKPIVSNATAKLRLAAQYDRYAQQAAQFGLIKQEDANLDDYVTRKALDGLFLVIADEEKRIRQDPLGQASKLLRKVFGADR